MIYDSKGELKSLNYYRILLLEDGVLRLTSNTDINGKILILTANFGSGHVSVAKSLQDYVNEYDNNINIKIIDLFEIISPKFNNQLYKGYNLLVTKTHEIYNYFYNKRINNNDIMADKIIYKFYLPKIAKYIQDYNPNLIISTFPMCSRFVSMYKQNYGFSIPLVTCITDVIDNCEWIHENTNHYIVPVKNVRNTLVKNGINSNAISVTGIPLKREYYTNSNTTSKQSLGIKNDEFVILMMGGGMGLLPEDKEFYMWLNTLYKVKTIIITGNNEKLYTMIRGLQLSNIIVKGFTLKVADYMNLSDVFVTKAGGVSLFEAIQSEVPIIAYEPILAQEYENGNFIKEQQIGLIAKDIDDFKNIMMDYVYNNELKNDFKKNIKELKASYSINNLDVILERYCFDIKNKKVI